MTKGKYQIPFRGDFLMHYPGYYDDIVWKDNYEFSDILEYVEYGKGRSSTVFYFKSKTDGKSYSMFVSDFDSIVNNMMNGVIEGKFTFVKKGQNYGLKMIK